MKIIIIRSRRRKKTVSARVKRRGAVLEVRVPAWLSSVKAKDYADKFLMGIETRSKRVASDSFLEKRAKRLNKNYLGGKIKSFAISWSKRQKKSFGVCNHNERTIRISDRVKKAPLWVIDYLVLHELAHILEPNHGKRFWQIVRKYPKIERAKGFLRGVNFINRD